MAPIVRGLDFEIDILGARVVVGREPLCAGCLSDSEVDQSVGRLKDDLDTLATQMKEAIRKRAKEPLFDASEVKS